MEIVDGKFAPGGILYFSLEYLVQNQNLIRILRGVAIWRSGNWRTNFTLYFSSCRLTSLIIKIFSKANQLVGDVDQNVLNGAIGFVYSRQRRNGDDKGRFTEHSEGLTRHHHEMVVSIFFYSTNCGHWKSRDGFFASSGGLFCIVTLLCCIVLWQRRLCFRYYWLVCLFVCKHHYSKSCKRIVVKFYGGVARGTTG